MAVVLKCYIEKGRIHAPETKKKKSSLRLAVVGGNLDNREFIRLSQKVGRKDGGDGHVTSDFPSECGNPIYQT